MTQIPENKAAWLSASGATPLKTSLAPCTLLGPRQIVVKNSALGINSVDQAKQMLGETLLGYISYPFILSEDIAGTAVEVGEGVECFYIGYRVVTVTAAISTNTSLEDGF